MADCLPFNAVMVDDEFDRVYKAEDWAWYFATFIGNGVFPKPSDGLQVVSFSGMEIKVNVGYAFINGYAFRNPETLSITLDRAEGAQNRVDRIVVRWDLVVRDVYIDVLKGVPSAKPVATALTRDTERWELVLADIYVGKGATKIQTKDITDQRFNSALCGIVKGTVEEIDASVLTKQFNDFFKTYREAVTDDFDAYKLAMETYLSKLEASGNDQLVEIVKVLTEFEAASEQQWYDWFDGIRDMLASVENGEMLEELLTLIKELYEIATEKDIDAIIGGTSVDDENLGGIFEAATEQDIDAIIGGTYVDAPGEDPVQQDRMTEIVDSAFADAEHKKTKIWEEGSWQT